MGEQAGSEPEFRVLGSLAVLRDGLPVEIRAAKHRVLLSALVLRLGRSVPSGELIDHLWGDRPPSGARDTLRAYVMRLRKTLGDPGLIETTVDGYRLARGTVDLDRFRSLVAEAKQAEPAKAVTMLNSALALWRGSPLSDVPGHWQLDGLAEERLLAVTHRIDLDLRLGNHHSVIPDLHELVKQHPLREQTWAQLMLALYRSSRQAEALNAYQRVTKLLSEELGVSPGEELRDLHQRILTNDPSLTVPKATLVPRPVSQLPPVVGNFVGRTTEISRVKSLLAQDGAPVVTISGAPGVGKTSLAVRVGHEIRDDFPDGQLFVNLRGYAQVPAVTATNVLSRFLRALGVPPDQIPLDEADQAARFRTELAGKRVLVVLDNANSPDQVRPLLPGGSGCAVIVTSRDTLLGLTAVQGAHPIGLDVLGPEDSLQMVGASLGDEFVATAPSVAAELTQLCGHLPLALRIAVGNLTGQPIHSLGSYVAELRSAERLNVLQIDDDEDSAVRKAFDISYNALAPETRRLFRLLSVIPGPDFAAPVSAALAGTTIKDATRTLSALAAANLVHHHANGSYSFHDLIRAYAAEKADQDEASTERATAIRRMLDHYLHSIDNAALKLDRDYDRLPCPHPPPDALAMEFAEPSSANQWLNTELANIVAAVRFATDVDTGWYSWQLANAIHYFFSNQIYSPDWSIVAQLGLQAATNAGDLPGRAEMHRSLGLSYITQSQHRAESTAIGNLALENLYKAVTLFRTAGFEYDEANATSNCGIGHVILGQPRLAIARFTEAITLGQKYKSHRAESTARANLGTILMEIGKLWEAEKQQAKVLAAYTEQERPRKVLALHNLGKTHSRMGRMDEAVSEYQEALRLAPSVEFNKLTGYLKAELALALTILGRPNKALWEELQQYADDFEVALLLGASNLFAGRTDTAIELFELAAASTRANGLPVLLGQCLSYFAEAQRRLGSLDQAERTAHEALAVSCQSEARLFEGRSLTVLSHIELDRGLTEQAIDRALGAITVHRETGHRPGEAETLHILGSAHLSIGKKSAACVHLNEAFTLYTEMGVPQAEEVRALLAGL